MIYNLQPGFSFGHAPALYLRTWGPGYTKHPEQIEIDVIGASEGWEKILAEQGYEEKEVRKLHGLRMGESVDLSDLSGLHIVTRIH